MLENKVKRAVEKTLTLMNHQLDKISPICYEICPEIRHELALTGVNQDKIKCIYTKSLPGRTNYYWHCFVIAQEGEECFLIDTTFLQFMDFENISEMQGSGFQYTPYEILSKDETGICITNDLLKKGYTELTDEKLHKYLELFIMNNNIFTIEDLMSNNRYSDENEDYANRRYNERNER